MIVDLFVSLYASTCTSEALLMVVCKLDYDYYNTGILISHSSYSMADTHAPSYKQLATANN